LKLRVLIKPVGIFAVASVRRASTRLRIHDAIRLGPEHAQEGFRVHGTGTNFNVIRLLKYAVAARPVFFKL
jgi:hypothetical protein